MKGMKNWPQKHDKYITEFQNLVDNLTYEQGRTTALQPQEEPHNAAAYDAYLAWLGERACLKLLPPAFNPDDVYAIADAADTEKNKMPAETPATDIPSSSSTPAAGPLSSDA